jgi:putative transposase
VDGTIKTVTITRSATGKWYACLSVELEEQPLRPTERTVGIDVGLETFATLSSGEKIANPRFFRRDEKDLKRAQCRLSAEAKGTPERTKRRTVVARIHERIANRRRDFAHQVSRTLVNRFDVIAFETCRSHACSKTIVWRRVLRMLRGTR